MTLEERQALKEEILAELRDREALKGEIMAEYGARCYIQSHLSLKPSLDKWFKNDASGRRAPMVNAFNGMTPWDLWEAVKQIIKVAEGKKRLDQIENIADANALADQILRLVWNYRMAHR